MKYIVVLKNNSNKIIRSQIELNFYSTTIYCTFLSSLKRIRDDFLLFFRFVTDSYQAKFSVVSYELLRTSEKDYARLLSPTTQTKTE